MMDRSLDTLVGFAGDWHGNSSWAAMTIPALRRAGVRTLFHVGDFGIWPGDASFIDTVEYWAKTADVTIWVTPGNHEDYDQIDELFTTKPDAPAQLSDHIWLLPRGYRWSQSGRSFVSLGGAASIDYRDRTPGRSWWIQEQILPSDVERTTRGGRADILITHEAPLEGTEAVAGIRRTNPQGWPAETVAYARSGQELITTAAEVIKPALHVHGHWHAPDEVQFHDGRRVYSMGMDFQAHNLATLDLNDMQWNWISDRKLGPVR
ncbi:metallophosphoesterase [Cryobacterium sp. Y50]|uniref:metallophosphoesterase family protein n=1 Tax=Cryobacterium sp. Y50 TaxID=2048286 RepID=UPI001304FCBD|nr:metallophosphoesterase [Cryobacterium sp. Y50]